LFGAGTEATIIVLEWAMAELLRNKEVMQKLQREVTQARSTSSDHSNIIGEQDLAGMDYLRAVIKETLRLHSPAPLLLPHKSMQATRISHGYDIPSDTIVIVNSWAIGRDPEAWESPEEFLPERFVGSGVDFRGQHPGVDFAMSVVELALANLVARFDWALPEGEAELDMQETAGVSSRKKAPLYAVATQRCFC
jgi:cytochrome P450 family 1 subfamily D